MKASASMRKKVNKLRKRMGKKNGVIPYFWDSFIYGVAKLARKRKKKEILRESED